jgi:hypothetical protein
MFGNLNHPATWIIIARANRIASGQCGQGFLKMI